MTGFAFIHVVLTLSSIMLALIFLIAWQAFSRKRTAEYERAAQLPLED